MSKRDKEFLRMKYFVLKPGGGDIYAAASRKAMRAYARHIEEEAPDFSNELMKWADEESVSNA